MAKPALLFGLGATKAGTSWMHGYLAGHPDCAFSTLKELHYFDLLEDQGGEWTRWRMGALQKKLAKLQIRQLMAPAKKAATFQTKIDDLSDWLAVFDGRQVDDRAYLDYLGKRAGKDVRLIGDITPAYGLLGAASLARMCDLSDNTRFVYLLRDPLDRLWSNIRMAASRAADRGGQYADHARRITDIYLGSQATQFDVRSNYAGVLTQLTKSLPKSQLHIEFFERLFNNPSLRRLTDFLGISPKAGNFKDPLNAGEALTMDAEQQHSVLLRLRPQYEFVRHFFDGQIPALWQDRLTQLQRVRA